MFKTRYNGSNNYIFYDLKLLNFMYEWWTQLLFCRILKNFTLRTNTCINGLRLPVKRLLKELDQLVECIYNYSDNFLKLQLYRNHKSVEAVLQIYSIFSQTYHSMIKLHENQQSLIEIPVVSFDNFQDKTFFSENYYAT